MDISDFKAANPAYKDVPDLELADALHAKYYSDMPLEQFRQQVGVAAQAQASFSTAMPRDAYQQQFLANNPQTDQNALDMAMAGYDKDAALRAQAKVAAPADRFKVLQSPEAMFNERLNAKLQALNHGVAQALPGNQQPANVPLPKPAPDTTTTVGANLVGGLMGGLANAGAAGASLLGMDDEARQLDAVHAAIAQRQQELGGDTIAGRASSLVGGVLPALAVPAEAVPQLIANAGLFANPAFRDTYAAQKAQGRSDTLAMVHAAEAAGLNLIAPTVAARGMGAIAGKLGTEGLQGAGGAAAQLGQAAAEGAGFSAAGTVLDKGTDLLAGQQNSNGWIDPQDMAAQALGFGALRAGHAVAAGIAGHLAPAESPVITPAAPVADIAQAQNVDQAIAAATAAVPTINPEALRAGNDTNVAAILQSIRPLEVPAIAPTGEANAQPAADVPPVDGLGRGAGDAGAGLPAAGGGTGPAGPDGGMQPADTGELPASAGTGVPGTDRPADAQPALTQPASLPSKLELARQKIARQEEVVQQALDNIERRRAEKEQSAQQPAPDEPAEPPVRAADAGVPIDDGWHAFPPNAGGLDIPRADMPQIAAEHRGALTQFLAARGIAHEPAAEVAPESLKPTQREFSPEKVDAAHAYQGGERSILVSADNHVLDGHHQWLAKLENGEPVQAIRLNAPIADLIDHVREFPSATTADGAAREVPPELARGAEILASQKVAPAHGELSVVDPSTLTGSERTITPEHAAFVQALGKALGKTVHFFTQEGGTRRIDGMAPSAHPDDLFVNVAKGDAAWHVVAGHEFFHQMPEHIRSAFIEAIRPLIKPGEFGALKKYVNQPRLDEAGHWEEVAADLFGNRFAEPDFLSKALGNLPDRGMVAKVAAYLRDFIAKLTGLPGKQFASDKYVADLDQIRAAAHEALGRYLANEPAPMSAKARREQAIADLANRSTKELRLIADGHPRAYLRDAAAAELQSRAEATASKRSEAMKQRMRQDAKIDPERDHMLQAVVKLGGINRDSAQGRMRLAPEELGVKANVGNLARHVFVKDGGMRIEDAGAAMADLGYVEHDQHGKHDQADWEDKLARAANGDEVYTPQGIMAKAEAMRAHEMEQVGADSPEEFGRIEHYADMVEDWADERGIDLAHLESLYPDAKLLNEDDIHENPRQEPEGGDRQEAGGGAGEAAREGAADAGAAPAFALEGHDRADLTAKDARANDRNVADRELGDRERDAFSLSAPEGSVTGESNAMANSRQEQLLSGERDDRTIEVDGVRRPITNSKGQLVGQDFASQKAFWKWFGDSKAVDEQGRPLVVYHGTDSSDHFDEFAPGSFFTTHPGEGSAYAFPGDFDRRQRATGKYTVATGDQYADKLMPYYGAVSEISRPEVGQVYATDNGVFRFEGSGKWSVFSDLVVDYGHGDADRLRVVNGDASAEAREVVDDYEQFVRRAAPRGDGGRVLPVYLSLKNPVHLPALEANRLGLRLGATRDDIATAIAKYERQGYDGIVTDSDEATMFGDMAGKLGGVPKQFIIFHPDQAKSATGNAGTFDPDNPDIRYTAARVDDDAQSRLSKLIGWPKTALRSAASEVRQLVVPMSDGAEAARAFAKDFANNTRRAESQWIAFDKVLTKHYTTAQLEKMWRAADEENDLRRDGKTSRTKGLAGLDAGERATVELLHQYGEQLWQKAKDAGMVEGDGVAYWTPRVAARIVADGDVETLRPAGGEFSKEARNLTTSASSAKHRKYDTTAESEAALQAKHGEDAGYIKNIRVMPRAMAQLEKAIAGRTLVNQIKAHGQVMGEELFADNGSKNFVTLDHPALKRWQPKLDWAPADPDELARRQLEVKADGVYQDGEKLANYRINDGQVEKFRAVLDETGKPVMVAHPLFVRKDFYGPLKAVFAKEPNKVYQGLMQLKGAVTSAIMVSPLTHNLVIWGKALPTMTATMGWKNNLKNAASLGLRPYFVGNEARGNHALMNELIEGGLVPVSGRGMNPDLPAIARGIEPGRSLTAQIVGRLFDVASDKAGDAARRGIDKAGEFWHERLLWDRVADMQAGMAVMMRRSLMDHGVDQYAATRIATHFANRYAGMIPREAMSQGAHVLANLSLFSKSFTLTNLGAYKDLIGGLPRDVQAQIKMHAMEVQRALGKDDHAAEQEGNRALSKAQSLTRKKGAMVLALDVGAMAVVNSVVQSMVQKQDWHDIVQGFGDRLGKLGNKLVEHPWSVIVHPLDSIGSLSETASNPHGKEDRVRIGEDEAGNSYYMRLPVGKVGEEMKSYGNLITGLHLLHNKMSTFVRPIADMTQNEDFSGRRIVNPDDPAIKQVAKFGAYWVKSQLPLDYLSAGAHLVKGDADQMDKALLLGTATGLSVGKLAGGDAVAEIRYQSRDQQARLRDVLPDAREALRRGDEDKARELLEGAGETPREINNLIRQMDNPGRVSRASMRKFEQHASDEDKAKMEAIRNRE